MNYTIEKLFKKMEEDMDFAKKILAQTEKAKIVELAKEVNINVNIKDLDEAIRESLNKNERELSDKELEFVSGGNIPMNMFNTIFAETFFNSKTNY